MILTKSQTKFIKLTRALEIKTKQYKSLCDELEVLRQNHIDPNSPILLELKGKFVKNLDEIKTINNELKKLQNN